MVVLSLYELFIVGGNKMTITQEKTNKYCAKCDQVKPLEEYYKNKARKDGVAVYCKICEAARRKAYLTTEKGRLANNAQSRKWQKKNKEKYLEIHARFREKHKDKIKEKRNSEEGRKYSREYQRKRRREEPAYRLKHNVSRQIHHALFRREGSKRGRSVFEFLPYSVKQLKEHLESQFDEKMSWENYGSHWVLDHIYPQAHLLFDDLEHPNFQICWALENLQPLEYSVNARKSDKLPEVWLEETNSL